MRKNDGRKKTIGKGIGLQARAQTGKDQLVEETLLEG